MSRKFTAEIVFTDMKGKRRSVYKLFSSITEAYLFSQNNMKRDEYVSWIRMIRD